MTALYEHQAIGRHLAEATEAAATIFEELDLIHDLAGAALRQEPVHEGAREMLFTIRERVRAAKSAQSSLRFRLQDAQRHARYLGEELGAEPAISLQAEALA